MKFATYMAVAFNTFFHILFVLFFIIVFMVVGVAMLLFNFVNYVSLFLYMFLSEYSVSLCCSVYCLCVNVYCTTATGCQPNCSEQILSYEGRLISNAHSEISRKRDHVFKQMKVGCKVQYFSYKLTYLFFDIVALSFNTFFPT
jgi:hypothetical protein